MQLDANSDSSPETFIDENADSSPEKIDAHSDSSPERNLTSETEESLLSVVQSVSEKSLAQPQDSPSESLPESQNESVVEQSEGKQSDDYSDIPLHMQPRFKQVVTEKNEYKAKLAEFEPDAKQYRHIQSFMDNNQLTPEEVAEGLLLMAEMKSGDASKAYEALSKKLDSLALTAGKKLPEDLEDRIEQGYIDRDTAQSLYQKQIAAEREAIVAQNRLQMRTEQDSQLHMQRIASTVAAWETAQRANDPDFDVKAELVKDRVRAHLATNGMPRTAEDALALSKSAYEQVTQTLRRVAGQKVAMRPAVGGKVNGSAAPEPRGLLDVIRQAAAGA
ncbi:hypothetical protein UFOVP156_18 [uncultured Caudovirales phage]|uniref:Uncharacterized protein n=1 Tax=uncultured Caudovirales phage TaxID=2100421 RepID=A0A6J7WEH8_9CAUD|nr:hypothetical protein UFOVP156_18 [uncultured Caudovirales phage]